MSSIHQTKNRTYRVRYREKGRLKSKTFKRKVDAKRFKAFAEIDLKPEAVKSALGIPESPKVEKKILTFAEYSNEWLTRYARVNKAESTCKGDRGVINKHFVSAFIGFFSLFNDYNLSRGY